MPDLRLAVKVLHVGADVGVADRQAVVLEDDQPREAGGADALDPPLHRSVRVGELDAQRVPGPGHPEAEVRIVGEDGLSACGVRPGEDPGVAADLRRGPVAPRLERYPEHLEGRVRDRRRERGGGRRAAGEERGRARSRRWSGVGQHHDVVGAHLGSQEVAAGRRQLVERLVDQVVLPALGELLVEQQQKADAVRRRPRPWLQSEHLEFDSPASPVRRDEGVDPVRQRLRVGTLVLRCGAHRLLRHVGEPVDPLLPVEGDRGAADQLGELAAGDPPPQLHLEEALAGLEIALHPQRVLERPCAHGGDAPGIEAHLDPRGEAGKAGHVPVGQLIADVHHQHQRRDDHADEQQAREAPDPPSHAPPSAWTVSSWSRPYGVSSASASSPCSRSRWASGTA